MIELMASVSSKKSPAYWLKVVNNLSNSFNLASRDIDSVLGLILKRLIRELGASALAVWTVEENTNFMRIESSAGIEQEFLRYFNKTDRIKVGKGLIGKAMAQRKALYALDIRKAFHLSIPRWQDFMFKEGYKSLIAAPMFIGEKIVGAFVVYYRRPPSRFDESEVQFIEIIANQTAVTLENIRNYQTIAQTSQNLLDQISHTLELQKVTESLAVNTNHSIGKMLELLFEYLKERFRAGGLSLLETDESGENLKVYLSLGLDPAHQKYISDHPMPLKEGSSLAALAFKGGEIKTTSRAFTDERIAKNWRTLLSIQGWPALAAFPMIVGEVPVGVMAVHYNTVHEFSKEEISIFDVMAKYLGIYLLNLKFFQTITADREQMASIINSLYDGLIVYDLDGRITALNPQAEELLGVKAQEAVGKTTSLLDDRANPHIHNIKTISALELADLENREITITEPAERIFVITLVPLRGEKRLREGSMRIIHDITRENEVERLRRNFVAVASHQLRTPLTSIRWMIDGMLRGSFGSLTDAQQHYLDGGFKATNRLLSIVNDLILVSRMDMESFEYDLTSFGIFDLVKEIVSEISSTLPSEKTNIKFIIEDHSEKVPEIVSDRKRLKMALMNIMDNAVTYTKEGSITIAVRFENVMKNSIVISIKDTGIGIPKRFQKSIFTKFFRAPNAMTIKPDGSGLGLFIAKELIRYLNGKIWAESEESKGSTFYLMIPLVLVQKNTHAKESSVGE